MGDSVREKRRNCRKTCDKPHYPYELPEGWCWTNVGDIASSILYGVSESAKSEGEYKLLRITDIQDNAVNWKTVPHTDFDETKVSDYLLSDGDILFARTGATVGKSYLVHGIKCKAIYASYLIRVQTFKDVLPEYVKRFFESGFYWEQIQGSSVGIGQPNVNGTILSQLMIPIPPKEEQYRIVENLRSWLSVVDVIEDGKESLQTSIKQTKSKILDLAIHGKLVPQDPTDDPASELLKRINPKAVIACDNPHYRNLPKGWAAAPMQMLCSLVDGEKQSGVERINLDVKFLRGEREAKVLSAGKYVAANTLLILVDGENSGEVFRTPVEGYQGSTFKQLAINDNMYTDYVLQVINLQRKTLRENKVGSAIPHLNKKLFKAIEVPIPPFEEQQRIVNALNKAFTTLDEFGANL